VWAAAVIVCFGIAVAAHAVMCRWPVTANSVEKFLAIGAVGGLLLGGHQLWWSGLAIDSWAAVLLYALACELYIFLFTLVLSSVSASILLALRTGSLTEPEIERATNSTHMVETRLDRLRATGLLGRGGAGAAVTDKGRLLLAGFRGLRRFFRHDR
jgi:hypothetical protein